MTLNEHMPDNMRRAVDGIVEALRPEPWPNRFLTLFGMLCGKLEARADPDPSLLLQQWAGIVTQSWSIFLPMFRSSNAWR